MMLINLQIFHCLIHSNTNTYGLDFGDGIGRSHNGGNICPDRNKRGAEVAEIADVDKGSNILNKWFLIKDQPYPSS